MEGDINFKSFKSVGHKAIHFCKNIVNLTTPSADKCKNVVPHPSNKVHKSPNPSDAP